MATINGTAAANGISPVAVSAGVTGGPVTNGGDTINGLAGNDTITGGSGSDTIDGGSEDDLLDGGAGNDSILGGSGNDTLNGNTGDDTLDGGAGVDSYIGGSGIDTVTYVSYTGGPVTASLTSNALNAGGAAGESFIGIENLTGGPGVNTFYGDAAANTLRGDVGDDDLFGAAGNDSLFGGAGNDTLDGGLGNDLMTGGSGDDTYLVDSNLDIVQELVGGGNDTVYFTFSNTMVANTEIGRLTGSAGNLNATAMATSVQLVANPTVASVLLGSAQADVLWGGSVNSTLNGMAGDDVLRDQSVGCTMIGGAGNDSFVIGSLNTTIVELANEGIDTAYITVNGFQLPNFIEITRLGGTATGVTGSGSSEDIVANPLFGNQLNGGGGNDVLWGSPQGDFLNGGTGDDIMRGQGGADTMSGGVGNDQYVCFDQNCQVIEAAGEGYDIVYFAVASSFGLAIGANVEEGRLVALGTNLFGNNLDNLLVGNSSGVASVIDGGAGDDIIYGTAAADTLTGGAGNDTIYCQGGADVVFYDSTGWGVDLIGGFSQAAGAKLDLSFTGLTFADLYLSYGNGNTQVTAGADIILVFGATLTVNDFIIAG